MTIACWYDQWAGNLKGWPEDPARCVAKVYGGWYSLQCSRKRGLGPDGLYCWQHAKKAGVKEMPHA